MSATPAIKRGSVAITWLGHSAFHIISPGGKSILIDPWLDNPKAPPGAKEIAKVDLILVSHGHADHLGNTVEVARRTRARVIAIYEVALYLQRAGVEETIGINISGSTDVDGIQVTMVEAKHSGAVEAGKELFPGGEPAGYVIKFENGFTAYHTGDTGIFYDMKLIGELYRPDLAMLPIGGFYTMGPREAAKACELIGPKYIIGMHYGTFPLLAGTPQELTKHLPPRLKPRVRILEPGVRMMLP